MNILDTIELQVSSEYLFMLEYGYSDTLEGKEVELFNTYMNEIREAYDFDYVVLVYDNDHHDHYAKCDIGKLFGMVHEIELLMCKNEL